MEEALSAGLGEGQKFIEDDKVHAGQMLSYSTTAIAGLGLEPVDEVDVLCIEPEKSGLIAFRSLFRPDVVGLTRAATVMMAAAWR